MSLIHVTRGGESVLTGSRYFITIWKSVYAQLIETNVGQVAMGSLHFLRCLSRPSCL